MDEESVTYLPAGSATQLQMCLYIVATDSNISAGRCNSNRHVCWSSLIVTDMPVGLKQRLKTWVLQHAC